MRIFDDSIIGDEIDLELGASREGVARYRRLAQRATRRGSGAALKPAERLLLGWFRFYLASIREEVRQVLAGESGTGRAVYGPAIVSVDPARQAVIAMHMALGQTLAEPAGVNQARLAESIGKAVNAEWVAPTLREDPKAWDAVTHTDRRQITPGNVMKIARKHRPEADWGRRIHAHLGACLLKRLFDVAFVADAPAFERRYSRRSKQRSLWLVRLAHEARRFIDDGHSYRQYLRPRYVPMIVSPRPWRSLDEGGYLRHPLRLVKRTSPAHRRRLRGADLSRVFAGVNALQATAWQVNRRIYDVVADLWASGGRLGGLPRRNPVAVPPVPANFDSDANVNAAWRKEAAGVHRTNADELAERVTFAAKLQVAERFGDREAIWFPHQIDLRGRLYAVPLYLNHQGDDVCRGLLQFAEGRPLGERGIYWLKVHLANCCKVKGSFAQRLDWVDASQDVIAGWAADPLENTGWLDADKPFQALAAAMALAEGGPCHIPVQVDGTCNALQHYAALARDRSDAAMVNLLASETPADPYSRIAQLVAQRVASAAADGYELAKILDAHVTRDVVKQPCMTTLYGVTQIGARRQVTRKLEGVDEEHRYEASKYLAKLALQAMRDICGSAGRIMDYLASAAHAIAVAGRTVCWTTPLGLPVEQPYRRYGYMRVTTLLQQIALAFDDETRPPAIRKQAQAFAPNFIHSLDSSHMLITAQWAEKAGLTLAGVHDGYWTHAGDVDALGEILRDAFYALHDRPILPNLAAQLAANYPHVKLPGMPELGDWDLSDVLDSTYSFS